VDGRYVFKGQRPANDTVLAMVLREAVTNVVRHSGAGRCRINIFGTEQATTLTVADNGSGEVIEGFGIKGMRHRLTAIGGHLDIEGSAAGTTLTAVSTGNPT